MNKNLCYAAYIVVLLAAAGSAWAVSDNSWKVAADNNDWFTAANWSAGILPATPAHKARTFETHINTTYMPIIESGDAVAYQVEIGGDNDAVSESKSIARVTINSGTLTATDYLRTGASSTSNRWGALYVNGGTVTVGGIFTVGWGSTSLDVRGWLYMTGGTMTVGELRFANATGASGIAYISGGTINATTFSMRPNGTTGTPTTLLDITGDGSVVLNGNVTSTVQGYIDSNYITAYGDTGVILMDYDVTNSGKTTIAASSDDGKASGPTPDNNATDVDVTTDLSWTAVGATSYDVYFGTESPGTFQGNQTDTTFDTGTMDINTTYYWRIDSKNSLGTTTGDVWSFTTQLVAVEKFGSYDGLTNQPLTLPDEDGNNVTFTLKSGGYGEIDINDPNFENIVLHNTTMNSILTIKTVGKAEISVGNIVVGDDDDANGLKSIVAATTNLQGDITVYGGLGTLTLGDVADDHTITIGQYPDAAKNTAGVQIKFDQVADTTIDSNLPIKKLTATEWLGGSIEAPSIGTISITGKKTPLIAGDLDVNVVLDGTINSVTAKGTLSGEWTCDSIKSITAPNLDGADITLNLPPDLKLLALGKLTATGTMDLSQIRSTGNIGTVSVGKMQDSSCFAGVTDVYDVNAADDVLDLPVPATDINDTAPLISIKSITIKGIKGSADANSYINSNVAAAQITTASLYYPQYDNNDVPFGLAADYIKTLKVKDAGGSQTIKGLNDPNDSGGTEDFVIRIDQLP